MSMFRFISKSFSVSVSGSACYRYKICDNTSRNWLHARSFTHQWPAKQPEKDFAAVKKPPDDLMPIAKSAANEAKQGLFRKSLTHVNILIEELSHMDEVRKSQENVIRLKDQLIDSGQQKRDILYKLSILRNDLKQVHEDSRKIDRGSEDFMTLIRNEITLTKQEKQLQTQYDRADEEERNLFTQLTTAINDSYEKEKLHANTLRLWGLIATIITSTITLILSTIGHYYHTTQISLVGSKFKDTEHIFQEIRLIRDIVQHIQENQEAQNNVPAPESWSSYLMRKTCSVFRYFIPKSNDSP